MRIKGLELSSFRAFTKTHYFDLNADAVIIVGSNGQGKTSLFDGILWALTGSVSRLNCNDSQLLSMYSESGEIRVALDLISDDGESLRIIRSFDGEDQHLRLELSNTIFREGSADLQLLEALWPQALLTADGVTALESAITRSVYLQQDLVRQFIEADTEQERFSAVSELVGAGRVTELHVQLERAKKAWTRVTNIRKDEREDTRYRLSRLEEQLSKLSNVQDDVYPQVESAWGEWWSKSEELGVRIQSVPSSDSLNASTALDTTLKQLGAIRRANDRRHDLAAQLLADIKDRPQISLPDRDSLQDEVEDAQRAVSDAREALAEAEERAAQERRQQVEIREAREELRTIAQIALRHLGDRCPVCTQEYDEKITRQHLEELVQAPHGQEAPFQAAKEVNVLNLKLEELERKQAKAEAKLREVDDLIREHQAWQTTLRRRLVELDLDPELGTAATEALESLIRRLSDTTVILSSHQEMGEDLALSLAQAADLARRAEIENEVNEIRKEIADLDKYIHSREQTGESAGLILDGLREAASDVVKARLQSIEPLLQRIYARVDPHPAFRLVRFLTSYSYGRGHLITAIDDPVKDLSTTTPSVVLSSSQLNALAVSVFLAFNLGVPSLPLSSAILDDPFQSLDDVNLLGLIDLLRRTKDRSQLLISTHDARFASLLERKLRPIAETNRTITIELDGWSREGPVVMHRDVLLDQKPLRIAA